MTLDEAIARTKEIAKTQRAEAEKEKQNQDNKVHMFNGRFPADYTKSEKCIERAEEHEQLVAWLEELKRYKAQKFIIKVDYNKAPALKELLQHSQFGIAYPEGQYEVVPLVTGGPSDEEHKRRCKETADMLQIILDQSAHFEYANADENDIESGVLVKDIHFEGSYNWAISEAIELLRGESL